MLSLLGPVRDSGLLPRPPTCGKGFDSLAALVRRANGRRSALRPPVCVSLAKRGNRVKLLFWDRDGLAFVLASDWNAEPGGFPAVAAGQQSMSVTAEELSLLLWGIDPASVRRQKRCYVRPAG